jgi:hypothetical protein
MKDTLTFHLPLRRGPDAPPEATLLVQRTAEEQWRAGLAICSKSDQFVKRAGRAIAQERLRGRPFIADSTWSLIEQISNHLRILGTHRYRPIRLNLGLDLKLIESWLQDMEVIAWRDE